MSLIFGSSTRFIIPSSRDVIFQLEQDGWALVATKGSYRQFKHPEKPGRVTVAGKPKADLALGTLNSILKQAGLKDH